jgi:hypothetical protein
LSLVVFVFFIFQDLLSKIFIFILVAISGEIVTTVASYQLTPTGNHCSMGLEEPNIASQH